MLNNNNLLGNMALNRHSLATQQQPRIRLKQYDGGLLGANNQGDLKPNLQSSMLIRRNTSEFASPNEKRFHNGGAVKNGDMSGGDQAILPKNGISKGVSFVGYPDGQKMDPSSLDNASTAIGTSLQKTPGIILDRRHLRTRGNPQGFGSFDIKSPISNSSGRHGIFSSMSGTNFMSHLNLDLNFAQSPTSGAFSQRGSILHNNARGQQSTSQDEQQFFAIQNRHTFSSNFHRSMMRPTHHGATIKSGISQSQYLDRMQKNKVEKLLRWKDEEKNKVKAKKEQLEQLKTELEMIRLISGGKELQENEAENEGKCESPREEQSPKISGKLIQKMQLEMLRSDLENKGQLTSFASSMTINNTLTHTGQNLTSTSVMPSEGTFLKTPALITNAPNLSKSVYQPYFLMQIDDDTITANLNKMKVDLEAKLKDVQFKHKSEFFVYQKLDNQRVRERKELTSLTLRNRDKLPEQEQLDKALENIPKIQMLSLTAKEQARNLLKERKKQLDRKRDFYNQVLEKKIRQLKIESRELDDLKGAIGKRQKRLDEIRDNLAEIRQNNVADEQHKQELIQAMLNKNLEFKVLSGLEIIVKLEEALKCVSNQGGSAAAVVGGSMESMKNLKSQAVNVEMLTKEDLEVMNRQKIDRMRVYESHFAQAFPDIKQIKINDEYMQKRYEELCFSITSMTSKYSELVQNTNYKKKLIRQYSKFQEQVERDKQFLAQFEPITKEQAADERKEKNVKNAQTLNDMRCADLKLQRGQISQDIAVKSKIIAQTCTFINSTVGKYSYILREILQIMRIEQLIPGKERNGPEHIPLTEYMKGSFLQLIQNYASKFALENHNLPNQITSSTEKFKSNSKNEKKGLENSPSKKKYLDKLAPGLINRQATIQFSLKSLPTSKVSLKQDSRKKPFQNSNFGMIKSGTINCSPPLRKSDDLDRSLEADSFDISVLRDLKDFFTFIVVKQQHLNIFKVLEGGGINQIHEREFAYNYSKQYISQSKLLSKLCEVCQMTKQLGVNTAIYVNGLEFKHKYPKLGLGTSRLEHDPKTRQRVVQNAGDLYEDDQETFVPEEDYVNPNSKHIVYDLLLSDRRREEAEVRRQKRDSEREKALALMTEEQRRDQNLRRLQKQVRAIKAYERDEHAFREQMKANTGQVFNKDMPKDRETKRYVILEGQAVVQMAAKTLKNQQDPYKHFNVTLPADKVVLTSQASLERQGHSDVHQHYFISPNDMIRTLELKSRQKKTKTSTLHDDDLFNTTGGNFYTTQDCTSNKVESGNGNNGNGNQMTKVQQRELYTQRLIQKNLQRRTVLRIEKPKAKQQNVVLSMLKDKFPELEKLFMDTAQRRAFSKQQEFQMRSGSLLSEGAGNSPPAKNNNFSSPGGASPGDDETTQIAGTVGYNSDDQQYAAGGQLGGFGTQQTLEDENHSEGGMSQPIIKVKPVFPRGVFK